MRLLQLHGQTITAQPLGLKLLNDNTPLNVNVASISEFGYIALANYKQTITAGV